MNEGHWPSTIAVVGLGIMGSAVARSLATAGRRVIGFDTDALRCRALAAAGVAAADSAAAAAAHADLLLTSLPGETALEATVEAITGAPRRPGLIVAELSTLSLQSKSRERQRLATVGVAMLDCPISGTGAQAAKRDIVIYVSGDATAHERCAGVFSDFARDAVYLGAFGNGTRMKFVANLLVAIHNVAAAEAISLGIHAGLDPATLCDVLCAGAGGSRLLELRGPMMVRDVYLPATMKLDVWQKDMRLIREFAKDTGVVTPLFDATAPLYEAAVAAGRGPQDTAAVRTVLEEMTRAGNRAAD